MKTNLRGVITLMAVGLTLSIGCDGDDASDSAGSAGSAGSGSVDSGASTTSAGTTGNQSTSSTSDGNTTESTTTTNGGETGRASTDGGETGQTTTAGSTGGGLNCQPDANEPNDAEGAAAFLGEISDADVDGGSVVGIVEGTADSDWFMYRGSDDFFSTVDPTRELVSNAAVILCKYAVCQNGVGATTVTCPDGTDAGNSPGGNPGCCHPDGMGFELGLSCTGADDSAEVSISVEAQNDECVSYTLNYHF